MVWTIEGEEVIRLGDSTTHGGKVLSASPNAFYEKIPIARVGDLVSCPKCQGTHTIVSGAPHAFDHGKPIARNGDLVSCGAQLIARSAAINAQEQAIFAGPHNKQGPYDEQVRVFDRERNPVRYIPYFILDGEGNTYKGMTDENGCCDRVYTSSAQKLTIYLGVQALEMGGKPCVAK